MAVVRGTSLSNFPRLVHELGAEAEPLLASAGIDPEWVGRFDVFIPLSRVGIALQTAAQRTGAPDFGRRLSRLQGVEILGPVGVAARNAATVNEALVVLERFLAAYSPAIRMRVSTIAEQECAFIEYQISVPGTVAHTQGDELTLGVILQLLRLLLGRDYAPVSAHLPHDALMSPEHYRTFFGCPTYFAELKTGFTVTAAHLQRPLARDAITYDAVLGYLATINSGQSDTAGSVSALVRQLLPGGVVSLNLVAEQLAVHPKTLQRRLSAEGTTFAAVVDDVRRALAEQYLRDTQMTLAHLARELGYAEASVLTRSCHRWFGCGPAAYRKRGQ